MSKSLANKLLRNWYILSLKRCE